jgi:hypothetical protein
VYCYLDFGCFQKKNSDQSDSDNDSLDAATFVVQADVHAEGNSVVHRETESVVQDESVVHTDVDGESVVFVQKRYFIITDDLTIQERCVSRHDFV